jgi:hypothetical protein
MKCAECGYDTHAHALSIRFNKPFILLHNLYHEHFHTFDICSAVICYATVQSNEPINLRQKCYDFNLKMCDGWMNEVDQQDT